MAIRAMIPEDDAATADNRLPHALALSSVSKSTTSDWISKVRAHGIAIASGPSGSGKSILMHQVVVPALRHDHPDSRIAAFMPRDCPNGFFSSLWAALEIPSPLPSTSKAMLEALRQLPDEKILVIDGFEQIFATSESDASAAIQFVWDLVESGSAKIIAAIRCPFLEPTRRLFPQTAQAQRFFVTLTPLDPPARQTLAVESIQLATPELQASAPNVFQRAARALTDEFNQAPQAIPFLTPLLERWRAQAACGDHSVINWLHSGGLAGEIATHIDRKFQSLKPRLKRQLEPLLRLLVTWNEELTPSSTAIPFKAIEAIGPDATELTNVLLYERCLYLTGDDITEAQVQLTHPGLLQRWAIAKEMLEEVRRDLSSRRLLDAQALHWDSNGRRPEDQWLENELTLTAQTLLQKESDSLPRLTREFLTTFQQAEEQSSPTPLRKIKQLVKPLSIVILSFALVREFVTPSPPQEATPHATSPIKASSLGEAPAPPPAPSKITLSQDTYHPTPEAEAFNPLAH